MATHVDLKAVEEFLRNKTYPKGILKDKGKKSNFRKACKNFSIVNGNIMYKEKQRAVFEVQRRTVIIHDVHEGIGENSTAKALAAHRGRQSTYQKNYKRFFWNGMIEALRNTLKCLKVANNKGRSLRRSVQS